MKQRDGGGRAKCDDDRTRDSLGIFQAENHDCKGSERYGRSLPRDGVRRLRERLHAVEEIPRDVIHAQAEEVANLRAGDEDGDPVGEANDYGAGEIFHCRAHAGDAEKNEQNAGHHGAGEKAVDPVLGDDAGNHDDECAGWAADLRFGAAKSGNDEAGDDGAVDPRLRRDSRGDGKGHGEGQGYQADGYAGNEVGQEFLAVIVAQQDYGFGQPGV